MTKEVNPYRFTSRSTRRIIEAWIKREPGRPIPWTPLTKPLDQCTIALISSAGIALKTDHPFDQEGERQNPWWGDPSYRVLPRDTNTADIAVYHMHINTSFAEQDMNCIMPLRRLVELAELGVVGQVATSHYSIMGYILQPQQLLAETTPQIIDRLRNERVDVVILVPV